MVKFVLIISEASVTAGLAALAVILIRLAMKKAPKRWAYALWAVVFFRCLCPFSAESALSLFNVIPDHATETVEMVDSSGTVSEENVYVPAIVQVERTLESYGYTTPPPVAAPSKPVPKKSPFHMYYVIFAVWAVGAAAMALYGVISYILLMRKLKTAVKTEEGVYESDLISTAFSAGFFPPKIYVPCGLFEEERKLIIAHERVHIRRLDYIVKPLAFIGLTVHWFNPLIWLSFAFMTRDMELSCDEAVLKIFGAGEKKAYSEALLHVSMKRSGLVDNYKFMPLAFAETGIKGRVKNVLKYKKPTVVVTVLAAAVVIAACAALGTDAKSKAEDREEEIKYELLQNSVNNCLSDADGEQILLLKEANRSREKGISEGEMSFDSVTFIIDEKSEKKLIIDADVTELKINSMDVVQEDGKNILKAQFEFKVAEDFVNHGKMVSGDSFGEKLRLLMTEGGGNEGVYTVSAEYELEEDGSSGYSFRLYGFGDIPIYVNSDLVKAEENVYVPLSEGETVYSLDIGKNVCVDYDPDREVTVDGMQNVKFMTNLQEGSKRRSVMIGMRQCGADFSGEEITGLAIDDISVSQDKFTVRFKITYPEGGGGIFIDENEPNSPIRLVRGEDENVSYLYLSADYDRENVDEYAIDICGFDDIIPQINAKYNVAEEKAAEYTRISGGSAQFTLETGETGYAAYGLSELSIILGNDKGTFSVRGIKDRGVSIGCFKTISEGSEEIDFCDVLDFGDHPITAITVENMYTERIGSAVKLYTKIKVATPTAEGIMNHMGANDGSFEMAVEEYENGEQSFTILKEYNIPEDVTASFAVVVKGFETPPEMNTDYEAPVYVNSALDPHSPQIITYEAYERFYDEEAKQKRIEEELRRLQEEEQKKLAEEAEQKRHEEEEQRKLAEEKQKELFEYEGAEKYGIDFIETALNEGNVSAAYLDGTNVLILFDDGTFWYDIIIRSYSHFPHQTDYTLNDGVLVLNYDDGGALYFRQEDDKLIFDESSSKRGSKMEAPFYGDGYTLTSYETVVGGNSERDSENAVLAWYLGTDTITGITLYNDGTFLVENYTSSFWLPERPEKSYKFENGILSLEYTNGSVQCLEAVGNDLVYRKDLSDENYITGMPSVNDTFELQSGTSLNGERIEMDTIELNGKTYYLVSNETQLRAIGGSVYGLDKNYMQQCDIELSPDEWKAIGTRANPFTGSYNGNGFEIKGLTMTDPYAPLIGMFGYAENANLYNITLRDYDIEKAGSKAKTKSVAPIVAINVGSRVYDNNIYPKAG